MLMVFFVDIWWYIIDNFVCLSGIFYNIYLIFVELNCFWFGKFVFGFYWVVEIIGFKLYDVFIVLIVFVWFNYFRSGFYVWCVVFFVCLEVVIVFLVIVIGKFFIVIFGWVVKLFFDWGLVWISFWWNMIDIVVDIGFFCFKMIFVVVVFGKYKFIVLIGYRIVEKIFNLSWVWFFLFR